MFDALKLSLDGVFLQRALHLVFSNSRRENIWTHIPKGVEAFDVCHLKTSDKIALFKRQHWPKLKVSISLIDRLIDPRLPESKALGRSRCCLCIFWALWHARTPGWTGPLGASPSQSRLKQRRASWCSWSQCSGRQWSCFPESLGRRPRAGSDPRFRKWREDEHGAASWPPRRTRPPWPCPTRRSTISYKSVKWN